MDKFKFRAWDNAEKCMLDWLCITQTAFNRLEDGGRGLMYRILTNQAPLGSSYGFYVMPMIPTEVHFGMELYDGDVIKVINKHGFNSDLLTEFQKLKGLDTINGIGLHFTGIVRYDPLRGVMFENPENGYREPMFTRNIDMRRLHSKITVVGNICETPYK